MSVLLTYFYSNYVATIIASIVATIGIYVWKKMNDAANDSSDPMYKLIIGVIAALPAAWTALSNPDAVETARETTQAIPDYYYLFFFLAIGGLILNIWVWYQLKQNNFQSVLVINNHTVKRDVIIERDVIIGVPIPSTEVPKTVAPVAPTVAKTSMNPNPPLDPTIALHQQAGPVAFLVARGNNKEYAVNQGECAIGRDPKSCQVVLDHESVSGQHAKIKQEQGHFWLYDMGSTNGTYLNERRIQRQRLEDGDKVAFGGVKFMFKAIGR